MIFFKDIRWQSVLYVRPDTVTEKKDISNAKMEILFSSYCTSIMQFKPILENTLWKLPRNKLWIFLLNQLQRTTENGTFYSLDISLLLSSKDEIPEIALYIHCDMCLLFYFFVNF